MCRAWPAATGVLIHKIDTPPDEIRAVGHFTTNLAGYATGRPTCPRRQYASASAELVARAVVEGTHRPDWALALP